MSDEGRMGLERRVRRCLDQGDVGAAATHILQGMGDELFGFMVRVVGDETAAADAFQVFAIRLWQALGTFQWRSSLRTWTYTVARNAAYRTVSDPFAKRGQALGTAEQEALVAHWGRTATARWQQTREKSRLWELVAALEPEERELMVLRLGRRMSWKEVAEVMGEGVGNDAAQKRRAAGLRKRYERIKARLAEQLDA